MDYKLYNLLSKAREACAGSNVQDVKVVQKFIHNAATHICISKNLPLELLDNLQHIDLLLDNVKDYGDRLKPDQLLCDILNKMLEDSK